MKTKKLKIALGILSGRITRTNISSDGLYAMGWDWHTPSDEELKIRAEEIVLEIFEYLIGPTVEESEEEES